MPARQEIPTLRPRLLAWLIRYVLPRSWYLHPPGEMVIHASPASCLQAMMTAARPSTQRLHLRNIFVGGRRYHIQPCEDGFQMTTTSKVFWHYRRRTKPTAILDGVLLPVGEGMTRLEVDVHVRATYLFQSLLIPAFMTSILVYVPWHPAIIVTAIFTLFGLSWFGHRYHAMLEAHAMVWFLEKSLEDFVPVRLLSLGAETSSVIYDSRDFEEAWQKFYRRHRTE